jgi:hypothetical protein
MDFTFVPAAAILQADGLQPNPNANALFTANATAGMLAWVAQIGPITSGAITGLIGAPQAITLTRVAGVTNNVSWQLQVGQTIVLEPNTPNQEAFLITSVLPATNQVTGVIRNNHTSAVAIAFFLDQQRSLMTPDGFPPQGVGLVALTAIDPITGNRFAARAATVDGLPATNATTVAQGLVNQIGTVDRLRTQGAGRLETSDQDILAQILIELRTITLVLAEGLSTNTDPDDYRATVSIDYPLN